MEHTHYTSDMHKLASIRKCIFQFIDFLFVLFFHKQTTFSIIFFSNFFTAVLCWTFSGNHPANRIHALFSLACTTAFMCWLWLSLYFWRKMNHLNNKTSKLHQWHRPKAMKHYARSTTTKILWTWSINKNQNMALNFCFQFVFFFCFSQKFKYKMYARAYRNK